MNFLQGRDCFRLLLWRRQEGGRDFHLYIQDLFFLSLVSLALRRRATAQLKGGRKIIIVFLSPFRRCCHGGGEIFLSDLTSEEERNVGKWSFPPPPPPLFF